MRADQVAQVRGFADQHLRLKDKPLDSGNRRVSVIVQYLELKPADEAVGKVQAAKNEDGSGDGGAEKIDPARQHE